MDECIIKCGPVGQAGERAIARVAKASLETKPPGFDHCIGIELMLISILINSLIES
jgi:hypothetical protein